jgi:hypothetical protein
LLSRHLDGSSPFLLLPSSFGWWTYHLVSSNPELLIPT